MDFEERVAEAQTVLDDRRRWCELALAMSWRVRFSNWISQQPLIWGFGIHIHSVYAKRHPEIDINAAYGVLMSVPIRRRMFEKGLARKMFKVEPIEVSDV